MDVIANKHFLEKARNFADSIPVVWALYGLFWRVRMWLESHKKYSPTTPLVKFGDFPQPSLANPVSQLCTANQFLTDTYRKWCREIKSPARYSRKQWEFVYIMQALSVNGMLTSGKKGLGFGCGREPLPGVFANYGCSILATDLSREIAQEKGWVDTLQHSSTLDELYTSAHRYISRSDFDNTVKFQAVDMNNIPPTFKHQYDFTWSACALEHLGSLRHGMDFVKNTADCLKPGGIAVHTTEFNLSSNDATCEETGCSIYRAKDIQQLIRELEEDDYIVSSLNLNVGENSVDHYIDAPPYGFSPHLKLALSGFVVTSIGLIIKRPI